MAGRGYESSLRGEGDQEAGRSLEIKQEQLMMAGLEKGWIDKDNKWTKGAG